jgi:hypothetical protein
VKSSASFDFGNKSGFGNKTVTLEAIDCDENS